MDWGYDRTLSQNGDAPNKCKVIYKTIDRALQRWGKRTYHDYAAFQPVVNLSLSIVEKKAKELVVAEIKRTGHPRRISDRDRQYAVWNLVKTAIDSLRPLNSELPDEIINVLDELPQQEWSESLPIPQECYNYLTLSFAYVWKSKPNKQIALLFNVSERTLAHIRSQAVRDMAQRLCEWEEHSESNRVSRSV